MQIDIIGKGNVGTHLANAFNNVMTDGSVISVNSRELDNVRKDSDIYILCVADNSIQEVASRISQLVSKKGIIAHTSGTTPLSVLCEYEKIGVFYPLQTFTKDKKLNYSKIPFYIESNNEENTDILKNAARMISDNVKYATSEERKHLHIASVFACNFVNHLWTLSSEYLETHNLNFKDLIPLIIETTSKINSISPYEAQTGPARRHDYNTIEEHLNKLKTDTQLQEIYRIMTESIVSRY